MTNQQTAERRAWIRYPSKQEASCRLFGQARDEYLPVKIHDVSVTGIGLIVNSCFRSGAVLEVRVSNGPGSVSRPVLARVKQATAQPDGTWLLGCTLVSKLSDGDLQAFV